MCFLFAAIISFQACKVDVESATMERDIIIDGNMDEWRADLLFYQEEGLVCALSHDEENIYLAVSTRKPETIRAIFRSGFIVWLNDAGRNKKNFGINYPLPVNPQFFENIREKQGINRGSGNNFMDHHSREGMQDLWQEALIAQQEYRLLSGPDEIRSIAALNGSGKIQMAAKMLQGQLTYELAVALTENENDNSTAIKLNKKRRINVGLEIPLPDMAQGRGGKGPGMGSMNVMDDMNGMGRPGSRHPGAGTDRPGAGFGATEIWVKAELTE